MVDYEMFELGDVTLQCGQILRGAKMAYKTYGKLNAAKDNVIVYPCWYSGTHLEHVRQRPVDLGEQHAGSV
jgi:homoserine O-acetyltransferase/O-succinyltransferase